MTEIQKGAFEATRNNMINIFKWSSAPLDTDKYNKCWFNLQEDKLNTIGNEGRALATYATYQNPTVQDVEVHEDVESGGLEALIKIPQAQDYLDFVGGERVRMEFWGEEDKRGASKVIFDGDLRAEFFIPNSKSDFDSMFLNVVKKYDGENWITSDDSRLDTSFETTVEQFQRIVGAVDFDHLALRNYPVVIDDGEFRLDATDENERDSISGALHSNNVVGPDVENYYSRGFEQLFNNIEGQVYVETEQDSVVNIVRSSNDNALTIRTAILPVSQT